MERIAQRRDLTVRVQAVLSGRPLRLRVAEAALPCAKRIGADIEERCSLTGLEKAHGIRNRSSLRLSLSRAGSFRTEKAPKVVHFGVRTGSFNPSPMLAFFAGKEQSMKTLKLKLYPLALALIGVLAATGGYARWR